jgi:predicted glycogen debranching enzyme
MISFGRHICNDFKIATEKEWIITNRKGSYASSTILMTNTRKHHGLLITKLPGIDNRVVIFPNCDEELEISGHIYHISTHKYKKTVYPKGYSLLENFRLKDDVVTFLFLIDNIRLKKDVYLMKNSNTTVVTYTILTPNSHAKLHIRPLIAFREAEHLIREIPIFDPTVKLDDNKKVTIHAYMNMPPAYIYMPDGGEAKIEGVWYRDFFYMKEEMSGFEAVEDLYNIGLFDLELEYNKPKSIVYSTEDYADLTSESIRQTYEQEIKRIHDICEDTGACIQDDDYRTSIQQLISAAESFVVKDEKGVPYVMAGYPWSNYTWFRDTFASFTGLFLVLKKFEEARQLLESSILFERNGILPLNMTMDKNDIKYTSVDTTLWFFYALNRYLVYTKDYSIVAPESEFFRRLTWIMHKHINGTEYNIHKDDDDLLYAGFPGLQLTWMDSKIGGMPVTPRQGKPVEVNALWYNAVRTMQMIAEKNGDSEMHDSYRALANGIYKSFNEQYWNEDGGYLFDYVDSGYKDENVRPNQIFAISLPYPLIEQQDKKEKIMNAVIKELYTSFGLRTLSNMNVQFKQRYDGDQTSRDAAAHQGTVWGWTIGHFVTAYLKTYGRGQDSLNFIETAFEPFFEHLKNAGLSTVSEMFDGNFPYTARGRISHAWAVAELLRSYFEDYAGNAENA